MRTAPQTNFSDEQLTKIFDALANDTLTARNVADWYVDLHELLFGARPECYHIEGSWFWVAGERRERHWLIVEVEHMRQQIVALRDQIAKESNGGPIFNSIRRMARLI